MESSRFGYAPDVPRVTTSARRSMDSPLAEDSTGSWFDWLIVTPFVWFMVVVSIRAGIVVLAVLFSLH
jgi:hypothetical protein